MKDDEIYLVPNSKLIDECLTLPYGEFVALRTKINDLLLTYADRAMLKDPGFKDYQLLYLCEIGNRGDKGFFNCIEVFNIEDWLSYFRDGTIDEKFKDRLELLTLKHEFARPKY